MNKIRLTTAGVLAVGALVLPSAASATSIPTNFPGSNGTSCDAWHGAPGGFGPTSPYYTVAGPQGGYGGLVFGEAQLGNTGPNNSSYSASCNS